MSLFSSYTVRSLTNLPISLSLKLPDIKLTASREDIVLTAPSLKISPNCSLIGKSLISFLCDYKSVRDVTISPGFCSWALKCHHMLLHWKSIASQLRRAYIWKGDESFVSCLLLHWCRRQWGNAAFLRYYTWVLCRGEKGNYFPHCAMSCNFYNSCNV